VERPRMKISGPVLNAPDVARLTRFYEQLLAWEVEATYAPRPGYPPGDGWSQLRPEDRSTKIEIQFEEQYVPPIWPGAPGTQGMQIHLDIWVEDVAAGVAWAIACGALQAEHQPADRDQNRLRVMLDPAAIHFVCGRDPRVCANAGLIRVAVDGGAWLRRHARRSHGNGE
jgi:catechol 2,3-dioxygenase-like lactoylglutathione lyase family enzyme